ncbi:MAG TPA: hypothetical protein VGQ38_06115 [Gaiellaceae bacterium]|nr:hypothetical protein [Gaiellaceae bacterium]
MRFLLVLAAVLALAGCGGKKADPYDRANIALLDTVPVYPGASSPKTTTSGAADVRFASRDWTLPADAKQTAVVDWYEQKLKSAGWRMTGKSFGTLRATRDGASLSVGVRGRVLEAIANSKGA